MFLFIIQPHIDGTFVIGKLFLAISKSFFGLFPTKPKEEEN